MDDLFSKLSYCVEFGKIDKNTSYPPDLKGQDGTSELTQKALEDGVAPEDILKKGLIPGMEAIGKKFEEKKAFVPQMLISAKAMNAAMKYIKPYFQSGAIKQKGTFVIGTVTGDLHDIGKNIVAMMIEGAGWQVNDLGVDVKPNVFMDTIKENPGCFVGLSSLLTTTMPNMESIVKKIKSEYPDTKICIGGAPVNEKFRERIGADFYAEAPQKLVEYINSFVA